MTKFEIRAVTMAFLNLGPADTLLDVGAGTGSIAVQAALFGCQVYAIERNPEGRDLIQQNAAKFGVDVHLLPRDAPAAIADAPPCSRCFIGGSGGHLHAIFTAVHAILHSSGIVAANFIRPENMTACKALLESFAYQALEIKLIQTATLDRLGLMRGQNPVFLVKGAKP